MKCAKCEKTKSYGDFYSKDRTCKDCRKEAAKRNRKEKADYYREYDKYRFKNDPRVRARHNRYANTEAGKAAAARAKKRYIEKNPIKRSAHVIVGNALRDGRLIKRPCEVCGSTKDIHAHHDDYAMQLQVRWLCAKHHKEWHEENGEGLNA